MADWEDHADIKRKAAERRAALRAQGKARAEQRNAIKACGGGGQMDEGVATPRVFRMPNGATPAIREPAE